MSKNTSGTGAIRFFIVGAQRCGTTYLAEVLDEHPEVCLARPRFPEPKFFLSASEFSKGPEHYRRTFHGHCGTARACGEKSTSYFESAPAARRIKSWFPGARIIVSLRNPVWRAVSNYLFSRDNGLEPRTLREVFIEKVPAPRPPAGISVNPFQYLERGRYLHSVRCYRSCFGAASVKILVMESTVGNLAAVQGVYDFLGVEDRFVPASLQARVGGDHDTPAVAAAEIVEFLAGYYRQEIVELADELQQDLSLWNVTA